MKLGLESINIIKRDNRYLASPEDKIFDIYILLNSSF